MAPPKSEVKRLGSFDSVDASDPQSGRDSPFSPPQEEKVTEYYVESGDPLRDSKVGKIRKTTFAFNQYEMPGDSEVGGKRTAVRRTLKNLDISLTRLVAKCVVLLSRSSGRDKAAAIVQYGCMIVGHQTLFSVGQGPDAPWRMLEDSMSSGRKVFRLLKWVKEYQAARTALTVPGEYLGILRTRFRVLLTRFLMVQMHVWAGMYYFIDNMIWAAQMGFLNTAANGKDVRALLVFGEDRKLSYEMYSEIQDDFRLALQKQDLAQARTEKWKEWKNNASLGRLIFALMQSSIQITSLFAEEERLRNVFKLRVKKAQDLGMDADELVAERERRLHEVGLAVVEQKRQIIQAVCNLAILLSRLKYRFFKQLPLWSIGILGVIAGMCGVYKNWPKQAPPPKQSKHVVSRVKSIQKNINLMDAGQENRRQRKS